MIAGFTGSRQPMGSAQHEALKQWMEQSKRPDEAHHGDCVGADAAFDGLARALWPDAFVVGHPPDRDALRAWCAFDAQMPPLPWLERNRAIVDASTILVACPSGMEEEMRSGTWAAIRYARKQGKPVVFVFPDGSVAEERMP